MQKTFARRHLAIAVTVAALGATAMGCSHPGNPVRPSGLPSMGASAVTAAAETAASPTSVAFPTEREIATLSAQASALTPADLTDRGWTCFQPIPERIVCSRPNQELPQVPPSADRPPSVTFLVFDPPTGRFVGTEILIRTDLYKGQLCESTGQPYVFVPVIGYYECVHTAGR